MSIRTRTSGIMVNINVEPAAVAWTPLNLTNLVAWYKADAGVTGNPITQILDQSGNGNTLTNVGTVDLSSGFFPSGLPAIRFTAANSAYLKTSTTSPAVNINSTTYTFYAVIRVTGTSAALAQGVSFTGSNASEALASADSITAATMNLSQNGFSFWKNNSEFGVGGSLNTNRRYGIIASTSTLTGYLDGVATGTTFANPPNTLSSAGAITLGVGLTVGWASEGTYFDGYIGEVVVTAADGTSDLSTLDTYFKNRFGL